MDVFNLRYMKRMVFSLGTIGAWPSHVFGSSSTTKSSPIRRYGYTIMLFVLCIVGMVSQAKYLIKSKGVVAFVDLGQTCLTFLLCCIFVQRTLLPLQGSYVALIKEFALKFHLIHHKHDSDYSGKMHDRVEKICEIFTIIAHMECYTTGAMFNLGPLYASYKNGMLSANRPVNGTFEFAVQYDLPADSASWYAVIFIYNAFVTYNLGCMFCCHDLQICVFVFHIWGHLKIFEHNLNYFPRPRVALNSKTVPLRYSTGEVKEVVSRLKGIIKYYIMIKVFVSKTSDAYSISLCVYYFFHLVCDCVLLLECSTLDPNAMAKYGLLTIVMYQQLIQLSVVFELIGSKTDTLVDAVYGLPWEYMDNSSRRTVLILLQIVQQPLSLKACNLVPVGVQTMWAVIKASFSYFMMLRTFAQL